MAPRPCAQATRTPVGAGWKATPSMPKVADGGAADGSRRLRCARRRANARDMVGRKTFTLALVHPPELATHRRRRGARLFASAWAALAERYPREAGPEVDVCIGIRLCWIR